MLHKISGQYNNDYSWTSPKPVIPRIFWDSYPRARPTPYTHIGMSSSRALGTFSQGSTVPHKHFLPINCLNIICDYSISFLQCNHTISPFPQQKTTNLHTNICSNLKVTFQHNKPRCSDTLKHFMKFPTLHGLSLYKSSI